jgi:hypothetical protein
VCTEPPEDASGRLLEEEERGVQGLEGLKHGIQEGGAVNYYKLVNKFNIKKPIAGTPYFVLHTSTQSPSTLSNLLSHVINIP